jgi:hypothetical protein
MRGALALLLLFALPAMAGPDRAEPPSTPEPCPLAEARRGLPGLSDPLLPAEVAPADGQEGSPPPDYRHRLRRTPFGWPRLPLWCVWLQPPATAEPAARWDRLWLQALENALETWAAWLPIRRVDDPEAAQILIERRKPPLRSDASGRLRASHGRASLELQQVQRQGRWRLEPRVTVLLGATQRPEALQATALHELGHAFGLWGHSEVVEDVMAAAPGPLPLLRPTARDLATLQWLYRQPTRFGEVLPPGAVGRGSGPDQAP